MAKNEFQPFAIGEYANVISQSEYESLPAVGAGFTSGIAKSEQLNKVWRQSSVMASVIGDFIANNSGDDVLDDGDVNKLLLSLTKALSKPIIDVSHPVGIVAWFAQNKNPNDIFPGTTWVYVSEGQGCTIRIAQQNGSDLLQTGGSDTAKLEIKNLPNHSFEVWGETSTDPGSTFNTANGGAHIHDIGVSGKNARHGTVGTTPDYGYKGSDNSNESDIPLTSSAPEHVHSVTTPPHKHDFSGVTNDIGSGVEFSTKNKFITLMAWCRTA